MVRSGEIDMGITSATNVPESLKYTLFAQFKRLLIAPKTHPLSKKTKITVEDISKYPLLLPPEGSNTRTVVDKVFTENSKNYDLAMEITGRLAVKSYVSMGLGISILNEFYLTKEDKKTLFQKDVSAIFGKAERGILTSKSRYISKYAEDMISRIMNSF